MSLINETLKSIQRKEQREAEIIPIPVGLLTANKKKFIFNNIILTFSLLIAAVLVTLFFTKHLFHEKLITIKQPLKPIAKSNLNTTASLSPRLAKIPSISVNVKENITEIIFSLTQPILYHVTSDSFLNKINITFDRTQFEATMPDFATLNSGIANMEYRKNKDQVVISLTLLPKAAIRSLYLNEDKTQAELVVAIDNPIAIEMNHRLYTAPTPKPLLFATKKETVEDRYQTAMHSLDANDKNQSIELFKSILADDPSHLDATLSYAVLLIEKHDINNALNLINKGLQFHPDYLPLVELKARVYLLKNQTKLAINLLKQYSPPMATNLRFYGLLASLYQETHQYQDASVLYQNLLAIDDTRPDWWLGLGISLEKLSLINEAHLAYKQALITNTNDEKISYYLNQRLAKLGNDNAS